MLKRGPDCKILLSLENAAKKLKFLCRLVKGPPLPNKKNGIAKRMLILPFIKVVFVHLQGTMVTVQYCCIQEEQILCTLLEYKRRGSRTGRRRRRSKKRGRRTSRVLPPLPRPPSPPPQVLRLEIHSRMISDSTRQLPTYPDIQATNITTYHHHQDI